MCLKCSKLVYICFLLTYWSCWLRCWSNPLGLGWSGLLLLNSRLCLEACSGRNRCWQYCISSFFSWSCWCWWTSYILSSILTGSTWDWSGRISSSSVLHTNGIGVNSLGARIFSLIKINIIAGIVVIIKCSIAHNRWRYNDAIWQVSFWLKSHHISSVFNNSNFTGINVHISIFAFNTTISMSGF